MDTQFIINELFYIIISILVSWLIARLYFPEALQKKGWIAGGAIAGYLANWLLDLQHWFNLNHPSPMLDWSLKLLKILLVVFLYYFIIKETYKQSSDHD